MGGNGHQCCVMSDGVKVRLSIGPEIQRARMIDVEDEEAVAKDREEASLVTRKESGSCFFALLH